MISFAKYLGRVWSPDFTCWDLVREVYRLEHSLDLPPYPAFVSQEVAGQVFAAVSLALAPGGSWVACGSQEPDQIVLFGGRRFLFHVGYFVSRDMVLHLPENALSRIEPFSRLKQKHKTSAFYRHASFRASN